MGKVYQVEIHMDIEHLSGENEMHTWGAILADLCKQTERRWQLKLCYLRFCSNETSMSWSLFISTEQSMINYVGQAILALMEQGCETHPGDAA